MAITPFTHHEILGLIEPFARRGRLADLAHSDRLARRLAFRAIDHAATAACPVHREILELDNATPGIHRLWRTLELVEGIAATLWVEGPDPAELLDRIEQVPHVRQLPPSTAGPIALCHRIDAAGDLRLMHGFAKTGGLTLRLAMPNGGRRADIALSTRLDDPIELPEDLLGVLGWNWSRLDRWTERAARTWTGTVGLRRRNTDSDAEHKLARAAEHIATTLAAPPSRFHEQQRAARWIFAFRRTIPLLVCVGLIVASLVFTKAGLSSDSVVRMLIFNAPPLMLVAFFCLREMPRIEWPRWPRRSRARAWRGDVEGADGVPDPVASRA